MENERMTTEDEENTTTNKITKARSRVTAVYSRLFVVMHCQRALGAGTHGIFLPSEHEPKHMARALALLLRLYS
jgi:hypothetical protein